MLDPSHAAVPSIAVTGGSHSSHLGGPALKSLQPWSFVSSFVKTYSPSDKTTQGAQNADDDRPYASITNLDQFEAGGRQESKDQAAGLPSTTSMTVGINRTSTVNNVPKASSTIDNIQRAATLTGQTGKTDNVTRTTSVTRPPYRTGTEISVQRPPSVSKGGTGLKSISSSSSFPGVERSFNAGGGGQNFGVVAIIHLKGYNDLVRSLAIIKDALSADGIVKSLETYLTKIVDTIGAHGGDLIKMVGDTLYVYWKSTKMLAVHEHGKMGALAVMCCMSIHKTVAESESWLLDQSTQGLSCQPFTAICAVGAGTLQDVVLGVRHFRLEHLITGTAFLSASDCFSKTSPGHIGITSSVREIASSFVPIAIRRDSPKDTLWIVNTYSPESMQEKTKEFTKSLAERERAKTRAGNANACLTFLPKEIPSLAVPVTQGSWQHRSVLQVNLLDMDPPNPSVAEKLESIFARIFRHVIAKKGYVQHVWYDPATRIYHLTGVFTNPVDAVNAAITIRAVMCMQFARFFDDGFYMRVGTSRCYEGILVSNHQSAFRLTGISSLITRRLGDDYDTLASAIHLDKETFVKCQNTSVEGLIFPTPSNTGEYSIRWNRPTMSLLGAEKPREAIFETIKDYCENKTPKVVIIKGERGQGRGPLLSWLKGVASSKHIPLCLAKASKVDKWVPYNVGSQIIAQMLDYIDLNVHEMDRRHDYDNDRLRQILATMGADNALTEPLLNNVIPFANLPETPESRLLPGHQREVLVRRWAAQLTNFCATTSPNGLIVVGSVDVNLLQDLMEQCNVLFIVTTLPSEDKEVPFMIRQHLTYIQELKYTKVLTLSGFTSEELGQFFCRNLGGAISDVEPALVNNIVSNAGALGPPDAIHLFCSNILARPEVQINSDGLVGYVPHVEVAPFDSSKAVLEVCESLSLQYRAVLLCGAVVGMTFSLYEIIPLVRTVLFNIGRKTDNKKILDIVRRVSVRYLQSLILVHDEHDWLISHDNNSYDSINWLLMHHYSFRNENLRDTFYAELLPQHTRSSLHERLIRFYEEQLTDECEAIYVPYLVYQHGLLASSLKKEALTATSRIIVDRTSVLKRIRYIELLATYYIIALGAYQEGVELYLDAEKIAQEYDVPGGDRADWHTKFALGYMGMARQNAIRNVGAITRNQALQQAMLHARQGLHLFSLKIPKWAWPPMVAFRCFLLLSFNPPRSKQGKPNQVSPENASTMSNLLPSQDESSSWEFLSVDRLGKVRALGGILTRVAEEMDEPLHMQLAFDAGEFELTIIGLRGKNHSELRRQVRKELLLRIESKANRLGYRVPLRHYSVFRPTALTSAQSLEYLSSILASKGMWRQAVQMADQAGQISFARGDTIAFVSGTYEKLVLLAMSGHIQEALEEAEGMMRGEDGKTHKMALFACSIVATTLRFLCSSSIPKITIPVPPLEFHVPHHQRLHLWGLHSFVKAVDPTLSLEPTNDVKWIRGFGTVHGIEAGLMGVMLYLMSRIIPPTPKTTVKQSLTQSQERLANTVTQTTTSVLLQYVSTIKHHYLKPLFVAWINAVRIPQRSACKLALVNVYEMACKLHADGFDPTLLRLAVSRQILGLVDPVKDPAVHEQFSGIIDLTIESLNIT